MSLFVLYTPFAPQHQLFSYSPTSSRHIFNEHMETNQTIETIQSPHCDICSHGQKSLGLTVSSGRVSTEEHEKCHPIVKGFPCICGKNPTLLMEDEEKGGKMKKRGETVPCSDVGSPPGTESNPASPETLSPRAAGDQRPPKSLQDESGED